MTTENPIKVFLLSILSLMTEIRKYGWANRIGEITHGSDTSIKITKQLGSML